MDSQFLRPHFPGVLARSSLEGSGNLFRLSLSLFPFFAALAWWKWSMVDLLDLFQKVFWVMGLHIRALVDRYSCLE